MEPLEAGHYYHIYNRGNNKQPIFFDEENYHYFLRLSDKYLPQQAEIIAYCLLNNHFHFLIKTQENAINPSRQFSNLFNAYTKAINKRYDRTGSLFQKVFKRKQIMDEAYLKTVILYIHLNPFTHGVQTDYQNYPFSSFQDIIKGRPSRVNSEEVLRMFGDKENFQFLHEERKGKIEGLMEDLF